MVYVFDACALISYLNDEPGSNIVDDLLKKAENGEIDIYMSIVNLIEVHYANIRNLGQEQAAVILENILASPIKVVSVISDTVFQQSRLTTMKRDSEPGGSVNFMIGEAHAPFARAPA